MSETWPPQKSIWHCRRDTNGRKTNCPFRCENQAKKKSSLEPEHHWFIVISRRPTQNSVTVLPISSKEYQITESSGEPIKSEDINPSGNPNKQIPFSRNQTLVLCAKPTRIPTENLIKGEESGFLKITAYKRIIDSTINLVRPKT